MTKDQLKLSISIVLIASAVLTVSLYFILEKDTKPGHGHNTHGALPKEFPKVIGGENRPIEDPQKYAGDPKYGNAVQAYTAAKEIPHVLDKIFCYCYCQDNPRYKHKSLLTCYTDDHGANCGICQREAIHAHELYKKGMKVKDIVLAVNKKHFHPKH